MREEVESIINPFDEFALELALELKETHGACVTALSMGPPQAKSALREALARGVDDAFLISGAEFAGSDTWATSYALAQSIRNLAKRPDLILFGKQAVDGDTAQVGPGVSEFLDMPLVTYVISLKLEDGKFIAETLTEEGTDIVKGELPAVVTVSRGGAVPRFASLGGWMRSLSCQIPVWSAVEISADPGLIGLKGSPTRVKEIFAPLRRCGGVKIDARENSTVGVEAVLEILRK